MKHAIAHLLALITLLVMQKAVVAQDVSADIKLPSNAASGSNFKVTVTITKWEVSGFARLENILPDGFEASAVEVANSTFSFKDNKVKFLWMSLPASSTFTVSYNVKVVDPNSKIFTIEGTFAYIRNNETQKYILPKQTLSIGLDNVVKAQTTEYEPNSPKSDITPPQIGISYPSNITANGSVSVQQGEIELFGNVYDASGVFSVTIGNSDVVLDPKGNFRYRLKIPYGDTRVNITAEDMNANKSKFSFTVSRYGATVISPSKETKGVTVINTENENRIGKTGKYYALLVAEQDYKAENINDLSYPLQDAKILSSTLQSIYVFDSIRLLFNVSRSKIIETIYTYRKTLSEYDNFLLFNCGHGFWDEESDQGYWMPVDANLNDLSTWISNSDIKDQFKPMKCAHSLLISDACFSGGIFKTRDLSMTNASKSIQELYQAKSRKAMTSGALTTVPDKSVFLKYMIEALKSNKSSYLSSEKLFASFKENAINNTSIKGLIPQFGVISDTDDRGGDFIFIKK